MMNETRRQCAALQNENTRQAQVKAHFLQNKGVPRTGNSNGTKGRMGSASNRRALGEIGNLVGRHIVSKEGQPVQQQENLAKSTTLEISSKVDRPITRLHRKSGADVANSVQQLPPPHVAPVPRLKEDGSQSSHNDAPMSWRSKQGRTIGKQSAAACSRLSNVAIAQQAVKTNAAGPVTYEKRSMLRVPSNHGSSLPAVTKRQTLTAILTARSEAACGGFEVEMEEAEEPLPNIDKQDAGNQLAVVDYVEDIYSFYRKTEMQSCVSPDYMALQTDINEKMRAILIDWLIEVHMKFKLMPETLFLTVNLIDRYLALNLVLRKNLQLVGVTAMLLACKYEEIWAPEIKDFVEMCAKGYTREQILDMEKLMLNKLKFNLTVPTPYVFLVRFLKAASSDTQLEMLAFFFLELSLTEYGMIKYCPSFLAAAAVYTAQQTLGRTPCWSTILQRHSGYTEMHLRDCFVQMVGFHGTAGVATCTAAYKKYLSAKRCSVAMLKPAVLSN